MEETLKYLKTGFASLSVGDKVECLKDCKYGKVGAILTVTDTPDDEDDDMIELNNRFLLQQLGKYKGCTNDKLEDYFKAV